MENIPKSVEMPFYLYLTSASKVLSYIFVVPFRVPSVQIAENQNLQYLIYANFFGCVKCCSICTKCFTACPELRWIYTNCLLYHKAL